MTLADRLKKLEANLAEYEIHEDDIAKLIAAVRVLSEALKCNETFHRLGGIDDCEPCKALAEAKRILNG